MKKVFKYTYRIENYIYYDMYIIENDSIEFKILNELEYKSLDCDILPDDILYYVGVDGYKDEFGVLYETKNNVIVMLPDGSLDNVHTSKVDFSKRNMSFIYNL